MTVSRNVQIHCFGFSLSHSCLNTSLQDPRARSPCPDTPRSSSSTWMDRTAVFCRLSGPADQALLGVQPREEDQLVHPGRAVNTLFTFLRQPECWDEPKAAFLMQRPDRSPGSCPASPQPVVLSREAWPQFVRTPSGGRGWYGSLGSSSVRSLDWSIHYHLADSRHDFRLQLHFNACSVNCKEVAYQEKLRKREPSSHWPCLTP